LVTTQLTAKRFKIQIILSLLAFLIGIIWFFASFDGEGENPSPSSVALILSVVGIGWFLITKFRIWWHHK